MRNLALFDFDGCIIRKDSFWDFIHHTVGSLQLALSHLVLSPTYVKFHAGVYSNGQAKARITKHHFGGWDIERFNLAAERYAQNRIDTLLNVEAIDAIKRHRNNNDHVVVVSGSFENWLRPWCHKQDLDILGTRLEVKNGLLTGNLDGKDCIGPEKVRRIRKFLNPSEYKAIYAYGDSSGDKEMLEMADVRCFRWTYI